MLCAALLSSILFLGIGPAQEAVAQHDTAPHPSTFESGLENQLGLTFSPDGTTVFWVAWNGTWGSSATSRQTIFVSRYEHGKWSAPAPVRFSGDHSNGDPFVSPDGEWLYFVSDRPSSDDDTDPDDNIWRYSLTMKQDPEYLSVNSGAAEYSPVIVESGALYFASARKGGVGQGDLYRAVPLEGGFDQADILSTTLNSADGEWNLWVSPDECHMMFEASSRPTNISTPGDLYFSWRTESGWQEAVHLVELNSRHSDLMPRLHPDGRTLYYTTAPIGGHAQIVAIHWASPVKEPCPDVL